MVNVGKYTIHATWNLYSKGCRRWDITKLRDFVAKSIHVHLLHIDSLYEYPCTVSFYLAMYSTICDMYNTYILYMNCAPSQVLLLILADHMGKVFF